MTAGSTLLRPWTWLIAHVCASCTLMLGYYLFVPELLALRELLQHVAAAPILSFMMLFSAAGRLVKGDLNPHGGPAWIIGGYLAVLLLAVLVQHLLSGPREDGHLEPDSARPA